MGWYTDGQTNRWADIQVDRVAYEQIYRLGDLHTDEQNQHDGQMNRQILLTKKNRLMDPQMEHTHTHTQTRTYINENMEDRWSDRQMKEWTGYCKDRQIE